MGERRGKRCSRRGTEVAVVWLDFGAKRLLKRMYGIKIIVPSGKELGR